MSPPPVTRPPLEGPGGLHFDADRAATRPRDAATLLVLRDGAPLRGEAGGLELFCVRRHAKSAFMGGVVVFPGGKLDDADRDPALARLTTGAPPRSEIFAAPEAPGLALAICACREALEEATLLPAEPRIADPDPLRRRLAEGTSFAELLRAEGLTLATADLAPFARWVTPEAEARRYDARFFLARAPDGQPGRHDDHETVSSLWASPQRLLQAFDSGDIQLAPPTTRCLELLATVTTVEAALALAAEQSLLPICPQLVPGDELVLALPGDPAHDVAEARVAGSTRFVLRDGRLVSA
ncbi:MAG: hypothetical protein R3B72_14390 [Polyangiaceae bacterium]